MTQEIIAKARRLGACGKAGRACGLQGLADLFFSPQGKEFCLDRDFPSLEDFRRLAEGRDLTQYGFYVDAGQVNLRNQGNAALIGDTRATLMYEGVDRKYTAILMHGAEARVKGRRHAVLEVIRGKGCRAEYDIDNTTVML